MHTKRRANFRPIILQASLLAFLIAIAVAVALLAIAIPAVNVELPVTPTFTPHPISPHAGL
jgi:hypothetical protein